MENDFVESSNFGNETQIVHSGPLVPDADLNPRSNIPNSENELHQASNSASCLERVIRNMEDFYPQLEKVMQSTEEATIFIPASYDMVKGAVHESLTKKDKSEEYQKRKEESKSRDKGQKAEEHFRNQFSELKIGGLYISGMDARELMKEMGSRCEESFEIDGIFLHSRLGICIIEIKAAENKDPYGTQLEKAIGQVQRAREGLQEIYAELTSRDATKDFDIHKVICFPYNELLKHSPLEKQDYDIIRESLFKSKEDFKLFWLEKLNANDRKCEEMESFLNFAKILGGYRSRIYVSTTFNALEIVRIFHQPNYVNELGELSEERPNIMLTNEQLRAEECTAKCILLTGGPGTGKTLVILLRALRAAREEGCGGRVLVHTESKHLVPKFKQFFNQNREESSYIREPLIVCGKLDDRPKDDVFSDETASFISHFKERLKAPGSTTVSITGFHHPASVRGMIEKMNDQLKEFQFFEFEKVIRGTRSIALEWHRTVHYQDDREVSMGHNISGALIERISVFKESELLEKLVEKIRFFLPKTKGSENKNDITMIPSHIAVITDYDTTSELVKKHLKANGINCGSVEEQVHDPTLVAVESSLHIMSYEWPIVIVVAKYCIDIDVSFFLRAASRCIAQLVVIERDYMAVQRDLDDILQKHDFSQLPFDQFQELVKEARSNKYDEDTLELDIAFAIVRSDYLALSIRNSRYFGKSKTFSDWVKQIAEDKFICHLLLSVKDIRNTVLSISDAMESRKYITPIFLQNLIKDGADERYRKFYSLLEGLHNTNLNRRWWSWLKLPKIFLIIWLPRDPFFQQIMKLHKLHRRHKLS